MKSQNEFYGKQEYNDYLRKYFAAALSNTADKFLSDVSGDYIIQFLGLPPETKYDVKHYFDALAKVQIKMADALLLELSKTP